MEVILREAVEKLGHPGDVVTVSPGFGRNYLLPRGIAYEATPGNLKRIAQEKGRLEAAESSRRDALVSEDARGSKARRKTAGNSSCWQLLRLAAGASRKALLVNQLPGKSAGTVLGTVLGGKSAGTVLFSVLRGHCSRLRSRSARGSRAARSR